MKTLTFVIIGGKPGIHAKDLINEIVRCGYKAIPVRMNQITFSVIDEKCLFKYEGFDLNDGDIFLFRGGYRTVKPSVITLAQYLKSQGKIIINEDLGKSGFWGDKVFQASILTQHKIPHPKTMQVLSLKHLPVIFKELKFPIIVKPMFGSQGKGIKKFDAPKEASVFLKKNNRKYFAQEYIPIDGDLRIFVVGNKVIAGMKRHILPGDFRSNASLGAEATKISVTKPLRDLALKAAKAMDYEIAGVDIVRYHNKYAVLEVNSAPQWKKLKEVTGVDPSIAIVEYAIRKHSLKNKKKI